MYLQEHKDQKVELPELGTSLVLEKLRTFLLGNVGCEVSHPANTPGIHGFAQQGSSFVRRLESFEGCDLAVKGGGRRQQHE